MKMDEISSGALSGPIQFMREIYVSEKQRELNRN